MTRLLLKTTFLLLFVTLLNASPFIITQPDSSEIRTFNESRLDSIRALPEYNYEKARFSPVDFVDMVLAWLWFNIFKYLFNPKLESFWQFIIYLLAFLALIYIIRRFMKSEWSTLFYRQVKENPDDLRFSEDDIHDVPLKDFLRKSMAEKKYQDAVRLLYLILLKNLADKNLINWRPGKTNHEYQAEIEDDEIKKQFSHLTRLYEYIWYGDFKISATEFDTIHNSFDQFVSRTGQNT